jgi:leucine efflux protein
MSFFGVTDLWTYVVGAFGIILLPGPNSLYVLSVATARGVRAGFQGAFGVFVGDTILLICTALGAASLLRTHPTAFMVVKYAGATYLFWIGLTLLWGALKGLRNPADAVQVTVEASAPQTAAAAPHLQRPFRRALIVSLLNPRRFCFCCRFLCSSLIPLTPSPRCRS